MRREYGQSERQHPKAHDRKKSDNSPKHEHDAERNADETGPIAEAIDHPPTKSMFRPLGGCFCCEDFLNSPRDMGFLIIRH
jgi:hypothetical protein